MQQTLNRQYEYHKDCVRAIWLDPEELAEHADKAVDAVVTTETVEQLQQEAQPNK